MNYKKIIKSPESRKKVLDVLCFIPDKIMLSIQYKIKLGRKLDSTNPRRFTEILQFYKMYYRNPVMHKCVDKYLVRDYVVEKGLEDILIPLIAHYSSINEVDWKKLPNQFVMKTTHGGGGLNVLVCSDKSKIDLDEVKKILSFENKPVASNSLGREWAYYGLMPGLVVEQLLVNNENPSAGINDYKIFCYNGKPKYIVVDVDRYSGHKRNFYDTEWNNLNIESDCPAADRELPEPKNYNEMLSIASTLAEGFPFVRVDLYNIEGEIFFGELTFYPWSGYVQFKPDMFDIKLGEDFVLPKDRK